MNSALITETPSETCKSVEISKGLGSPSFIGRPVPCRGSSLLTETRGANSRSRRALTAAPESRCTKRLPLGLVSSCRRSPTSRTPRCILSSNRGRRCSPPKVRTRGCSRHGRHGMRYSGGVRSLSGSRHRRNVEGRHQLKQNLALRIDHAENGGTLSRQGRYRRRGRSNIVGGERT